MNEQMKTLLEAKNIHKTFRYPNRVTILNGIDLHVREKESVAIIGRSGQGKSTLLHILGTLEAPCSGSLHIEGQPVSRYNKIFIRNQKIGFVFQSFHLLEDYTALENVLMPAGIAREVIKKGSPAEERAWSLLERVGLADKGRYPAKVLSGGEKQRVALARALCNNPALIFADEPSGNLDRVTSSVIHHVLFDFSRQESKALILVTHDRELASRCTKQYELQDGRLF